MSMNSFYGGPNGKSFSIRAIFTSRYGSTNSLTSDLAKGWTSPIAVGEYVLVSYGLPGEEENYEAYRKQDLDVDGMSYNFTLWCKEYDEEDGTANGLSYKLQGSMTGNTPKIDLDFTVTNADEEPSVTIDKTNPDAPKLHFRLPQSQVLSLKQPVNKLHANEDPRIVYDESEDINKPTLEFFLPVSQVINQVQLQILNVGQPPTINLDTSVDGTIDNPVLKFGIPASQQFLPQNVSVVPEDANEEPSLELDDQDVDHPKLVFHIPRAQVMQSPGLTVVGPAEEPSVALDSSNVNAPKLNFQLPDAVEFFYGTLLGKRTEETYIETQEGFADYQIGDYYINAPTGFIYRVIAKSGNQCTFRYIACIQQPLPEISTKWVSPYSGAEGAPVEPDVERTYLNPEQTEWQLEFSLPKAPVADASYDFIAPAATGSVKVSIQDEDTLKFDFQIPKGARIFSGTAVSGDGGEVVVQDAVAGDIYLNSDTGEVYDLGSGNQWTKTEGSLKGPVGSALNVVQSYTYDSKKIPNDTLTAVSEQIQQDYGKTPSPEEIIAVVYQQYDAQGEKIENEISYWYFYTKAGAWGRVQLTGGISNLIETEYNNEQPDQVNNKVYSVHYVNTLIDGEYHEIAGDVDNRTAFSKAKVMELLSWGEISSLIEE